MRAKLTYCTDLSLREQTIKQKSQHVYKRTQLLVKDSMTKAVKDSMTKARAKSPCTKLPRWPSRDELAKASSFQLGELAIVINEEWNPQNKICTGTVVEVALAIQAFYEKDPVAKQDGLRDATKYPKPTTLAPWQIVKQSAAASSIAASAAVGSAVPAAPQQNFVFAAMQTALAAAPNICQHVKDMLKTCAMYLGGLVMTFFALRLLEFLVVLLITPTAKAHNVENMTSSQVWEMTRAGLHGDTPPNSDIFEWTEFVIKSGIIWYYQVSPFHDVSAFGVVLGRWWFTAGLFKYKPWVELFLLCNIAGWSSLAIKTIVAICIKYFCATEMTLRYPFELLGFYVCNLANTNNTLKALWQPVSMFYKSLQASKEQLTFLSQEPFLPDADGNYSNVEHPFHEKFQPKCMLEYNRKPMKELFAILGEDPGAGPVDTEEKKRLWKAHAKNTTRKSLCWLFKTVIKHKW